jgi:Zn-finger domain-containing protein
MIELLEKTSKENNIPFSAFEEVFKDSNKTASFLNLLGGRKNHEQLEEKQIVKFRR